MGPAGLEHHAGARNRRKNYCENTKNPQLRILRMIQIFFYQIANELKLKPTCFKEIYLLSENLKQSNFSSDNDSEH